MARSIALLVDGVTRTLTYTRTNAEGDLFEEQVGPLVGRLRLTVSQRDSGTDRKAIRTKLRLESSYVSDCSAKNCGALPEVLYSELWTNDIVTVKASSVAHREELLALNNALASSKEVKSLVVDAAMF